MSHGYYCKIVSCNTISDFLLGQTHACASDGRKEKEKKQIERLSAKFSSEDIHLQNQACRLRATRKDTCFPETLAVPCCAVHAARDVPCTQVPALSQVMNKAASLRQQIFIIQSFLPELGFPGPGWPDKVVSMISIFFTHQLLLVKGHSPSLLKAEGPWTAKVPPHWASN